MPKRDLRRGDQAAGAALVGAATLSMLAMAHHPTSADASPLIGVVHGSMIVMLAAMGFGFAYYSIRRGLTRPVVLAGLVLYGIGMLGSIGAATLNGFALPELAAREQSADHGAFVLVWAVGKALAMLGIFAACAAYLFWSADFLMRRTGAAMAIGVMGLLAGAVPTILLATGWVEMHVAAAFLIYGGHAAWAAVVGLYLFRGGLDRE